MNPGELALLDLFPGAVQIAGVVSPTREVYVTFQRRVAKRQAGKELRGSVSRGVNREKPRACGQCDQADD